MVDFEYYLYINEKESHNGFGMEAFQLLKSLP